MRDFPFKGIFLYKGFPFIRDFPLQGISLHQGFPFYQAFPFISGGAWIDAASSWSRESVALAVEVSTFRGDVELKFLGCP